MRSKLHPYRHSQTRGAPQESYHRTIHRFEKPCLVLSGSLSEALSTAFGKVLPAASVIHRWVPVERNPCFLDNHVQENLVWCVETMGLCHYQAIEWVHYWTSSTQPQCTMAPVWPRGTDFTPLFNFPYLTNQPPKANWYLSIYCCEWLQTGWTIKILVESSCGSAGVLVWEKEKMPMDMVHC